MRKIILTVISGFFLLTTAQLWAASVEQAMAKPGRLESDVKRDSRSHPEVVIPLLQLEEGDRVADIFAGGGYYSELLATVVGNSGEVLLQNNKAYKNFVAEELSLRFDGRETGSITVLDSEAADLGLGESTLDAALIIMSYHDLFYADPENGWSAIDPDDFLAQIYRALKPGGRFLIVDHQAVAGSGISSAQELHRIEQGFAVQHIEASGLRLAGASSALRNPDDDHTVIVFNEKVRGKTDRFILVFEK